MKRAFAAISIAALTCLVALGIAASASAGLYSQTQTLPVPPASSFAGSGGGDGWAVTLSSDKVFNVFHHNSVMTVNCNLQATATACWTYGAETVSDGSGRQFSTGMHPGASLDDATGKLYIFGTRREFDGSATAGVVCFDTALAATNPNPFCGFTPLSGTGEGQIVAWGMVSSPMQVGSKIYAFNFVSGTAAGGPTGTGSQNRVLCFDLATLAACSGQPYAVDIGGITYNATYGVYQGNASAIAGKLIIPVGLNGGDTIACFDTATLASCGGSWPVAFGSSQLNGPAFPLLTSAGATSGLCIPFGGIPCYSLTGAPVPTPANMTSTIFSSEAWNGPAVTIGPRVYVPNGNQNGYSGTVECFDYSTSSNCASFPKTFSGLNYLYTVNADPARPTCLWVNADNGSGQIQSFDAYTGGACGSGAIRLLASQFVVPIAQCTPGTYNSLQVISPAPGTYTSGTIEFDNGAGNPLGIPNGTLDASGSIDLSALSLNTATGLPQFLVTLVGAPSGTGSVVVKLTWTSAFDPACVAPGTTVTKEATTIKTSLTSGAKSGASITVLPGDSVVDTATIAGPNASGATGTVTYTWYSNNTCTTLASAGAAQAITSPGLLPASAPVTLAPGTYYAVASYSGDVGNLASAGACGDEVLKVQPPNADLALAKTGSPASQLVGKNVTYTLSVKNNGPADATGVTITDTLPAGLNFVSGAGCSAAGQVVTCTIAPILLGGTAVASITVTANAAGTWTDTATAKGDQPDPAAANNTATATTTVYSARSIKQDALAGLTVLAAGDVCAPKSKGKDDGKGKKGDDERDDEDCGKRFASPLRKVTKSLTAAWWNIDGIHLTLNGCGVFDNEKAAASQLRELLKSKKLTAAQKAAIQAVIDQLVQADQILATTAVAEATAAGGQAKKLAEANKALAKAAALSAAGKPDEAINQYRIAWEKAQESQGRKVCGDDGDEDEDGHDGGHHDRSDD